MKKIFITMIVVILMVFSFSGCKDKNKQISITIAPDKKELIGKDTSMQISQYVSMIYQWYNNTNINDDGNLLNEFVPENKYPESKEVLNSLMFKLTYYAQNVDINDNRTKYDIISKTTDIYMEIARMILESKTEMNIGNTDETKIRINKEDWNKIGNLINDAIEYYPKKLE